MGLHFFGFRIARIASDRLAQDTWTKARQWCSEEAIRCLYLPVDGADPKSSLIAASEGFRPVDVRITLDRRIDNGTMSFENVRPACVSDSAGADGPRRKESHRLEVLC